MLLTSLLNLDGGEMQMFHTTERVTVIFDEKNFDEMEGNMRGVANWQERNTHA